MSNPLEYKKGNLPEGEFRIGASSFSQFVDRPWDFYREKILGESGFEGNEASIIGTIIHYCAEQKALGLEPSIEIIDEYIDIEEKKLLKLDQFLDVDLIRDSWKAPAMELVNNYVLPNASNLHEVEPFRTLDLGDGIHTGGSIDRVENVGDGTYRITDYKSYNSKTKPKKIPMGYKYQLLDYALIYGNVSEVRLVYINRYIDGGVSEKTGKPLKSYPPEVTVLTEPVTDDDIAFIRGMLDMCKDTIKASEKYPELRHVLWRDPRLKE